MYQALYSGCVYIYRERDRERERNRMITFMKFYNLLFSPKSILIFSRVNKFVSTASC